jgi:hypothetical protein
VAASERRIIEDGRSNLDMSFLCIVFRIGKRWYVRTVCGSVESIHAGLGPGKYEVTRVLRPHGPEQSYLKASPPHRFSVSVSSSSASTD